MSDYRTCQLGVIGANSTQQGSPKGMRHRKKLLHANSSVEWYSLRPRTQRLCGEPRPRFGETTLVCSGLPRPAPALARPAATAYAQVQLQLEKIDAKTQTEGRKCVLPAPGELAYMDRKVPAPGGPTFKQMRAPNPCNLTGSKITVLIGQNKASPIGG